MTDSDHLPFLARTLLVFRSAIVEVPRKTSLILDLFDPNPIYTC